MASTPVARLDRVRYSDLNRREHSRRLRAFLERKLAVLTETGTQITADHTTDAGTKAEVQLTFVDPPGVGESLSLWGDGFSLEFRFVSDVGANDEGDFISVLLAVDAAGCAQNLAYALTQDTDHQETWANNATSGMPDEIELSVLDTENVYVRAVLPGTAANSYNAATDSSNITLSAATFEGGIEPGCIVTETPHGLSTGDGPFSLLGSSLSWTIDTLTTLYYIIVVDSTSFRLAPSPYDAALGRYFTLHRPTTHLDDVIKYRRAAETTTALFEQLRAGMTVEQLDLATDIDPA